MFGRVVWLALFILLAGGLASWLATQPGMVQLEWLGWQLEMRTSLGVAILVILALLLVFADRLFRGLLDLPALLGRNLHRRRTAQGHRALALGLMAVSAGEPGEARRQAARAQRLLAAPQLTDLLSAQAAHLSGDSNAATRYFTSLTNDADTAFLGHIGLARLALEDDRSDDALAAARKALALRPKSALAARQVLVLEAERGDWQAALPALKVVAAAGDDGPEFAMRRQQAALLYLDALDGHSGGADTIMAAGSEAVGRAVKGLQATLKVAPAFWPAAQCLAELHLGANAPRKAAKVLEAAFRAMPHEGLAAALEAAWQVNDGKLVSRLDALIPATGPTAIDAARIVGEVALAHDLPGEARRFLAQIPEERRDAAAWRLAAHLADGDGDAAAATIALQRAGEAPRPRRWQCTSCQLIHESWQSHCGGCAGFATLEWQRPDGITPLPSPARYAAEDLAADT